MNRKRQPDAAKLRRTKLAQVHILKKELHLDDSKYRSELKRITGKTSCNALEFKGLNRVIAEFRRIKEMNGRKPPRVTQKQWNYVRHLQHQLEMDFQHLTNFCRQVCHVDSVFFLDVGLCKDLITGLKRTLAFRQKTKGGKANGRI